MGRPRPKLTEIVRSGDDSAAEVVVPETVHNPPCELLSGTVFDVSDPTCQRFELRGRILLPIVGRLPHHDPEIPGFDCFTRGEPAPFFQHLWLGDA
jgi:hypothetical protein